MGCANCCTGVTPLCFNAAATQMALAELAETCLTSPLNAACSLVFKFTTAMATCVPGLRAPA